MRRFWGNHPGTRQARGFKKVKPASPEERLASMERELANRIKASGPDSPMVKMQRETIAQELRMGPPGTPPKPLKGKERRHNG